VPGDQNLPGLSPGFQLSSYRNLPVKPGRYRCIIWGQQLILLLRDQNWQSWLTQMSEIDKNVKKIPDLGYILPVTDSAFLV